MMTQRRRLLVISLLFISFCGMGLYPINQDQALAAPSLEENLLANAEFSGSPGAFPDGWRRANASSVLGETVVFVPDPEHPDRQVLVIDHSNQKLIGIYTADLIPVQAGGEYIFSVDAKVEGAGKATMLLTFYDDSGQCIERVSQGTDSTVWERMSRRVEPPLVWWTLKDRTSKLEKGCPHHGRNARQVPTTV